MIILVERMTKIRFNDYLRIVVYIIFFLAFHISCNVLIDKEKVLVLVVCTIERKSRERS